QPRGETATRANPSQGASRRRGEQTRAQEHQEGTGRGADSRGGDERASGRAGNERGKRGDERGRQGEAAAEHRGGERRRTR
ncbi:hypothetical protein C3R44_21810, partial [Mycobacterium tuberculosis]